jgi:hypothetical protein
MRKILKSKKGVITQVIIFVVLSICIIFIFGIIAPFGTLMTSSAYASGEGLLNSSKEVMLTIHDASVRSELLGLANDATDMTVTNISITTGMYQYGWLFFIIILGLAIFLYTRRSVELGYGGFV